MLENPLSFGGGDRYYGSSNAPDQANFAAVGGKVTGTIAELLKEYDPELERRVSRSFRQWNNVLAINYGTKWASDSRLGTRLRLCRSV